LTTDSNRKEGASRSSGPTYRVERRMELKGEI